MEAEECEACLRFYLPRLAANEVGLRQLRLPSRGITDDAIQKLCAALTDNTEVEELCVPGNSLTDAGVEEIAKVIEGSATLTVVDISENPISSIGVRRLVEALRVNGSVTEVSAQDTKASPESLEALADAASLNSQPTALKAVVYGLRQGCKQTLRLGDVTNEEKWLPYTLTSIEVLVRALLNDKRATLLDVSNHLQGDAGAELVAEAVGKHPSLKELRLDSCGITDRGAKALTEALRNNTVLTELRLSDNEIGDAGADLFIDLVRVNATLAHVVLDDNNITPSRRNDVVHALLLNSQPPKLKTMHPQLLANDSHLRIVDLRDQGREDGTPQVNDITCRVLSNCLRTNTTVHTINLLGNRVGDDGAKLLCALLKTNTSVRRIILKDNCVTSQSIEGFIQLLRVNNMLEEIDLSDQKPEPIPRDALVSMELHLALNREPAAFKALAPLLVANDPSVAVVDLSLFDGARRPSEATCKLLCEAMANNRVVAEIKLSGNPQVGPAGVAAILRLLSDPKGCCGVKTLALADMQLGDSEGGLVADLLRNNNVLTDLDLSNNAFTDLRAWTDVLRTSNHTLRHLRLDDSKLPLDEGDLREMAVMLQLNFEPRHFKQLVLRVYENDPSLTDVELTEYESALVTGDNSYRYRRRYNDTSASLLAGALRHNRHVTKVSLAANSIGDEGAKALAGMLLENRALTTLSLANNQVTDVGFMAIADALLTNPTLQCVVTDNNPVKDPMTRKHLNMATSHNAQVAATIYSTADTSRMTAELEVELDAAVMADAMSSYKRPAKDFKSTMGDMGEELLEVPIF
eukprot:Hpha_TRINITY_DN13071_c0_g1::TRINITY_DN13071_c0_g1_i1::g.68689::m.68689